MFSGTSVVRPRVRMRHLLLMWHCAGQTSLTMQAMAKRRPTNLLAHKQPFQMKFRKALSHQNTLTSHMFSKAMFLQQRASSGHALNTRKCTKLCAFLSQNCPLTVDVR